MTPATATASVVMNKEPLDFKLDMNKDIEFNCAMGDVFRALDKNI